MEENKINWKTLSLLETKKILQREAKKLWLIWEEEVNEDFLKEIQFLLWFKWWRLFCHLDKEYPYIIKFRLIGERDYIKVKPKDFIELAQQKLLH